MGLKVDIVMMAGSFVLYDNVESFVFIDNSLRFKNDLVLCN
jgi:hypothetical protein